MSQSEKIVNENEDLALKFLNELFGDKPDKAWIYLWKLKGKKSTWFQDVQKAAAFVNAHPADIYIGCGITSKRGGPYTRLKAEQVKGIPGFYADIDIAHEVHKKGNLPATVEEAMGLIKGHGFDPTIIIHSGHGLQAWWLFKEPWLFDTDEEREQAYNLSVRLHETIKQRASEQGKKKGAKNGWTVDGVFDLTRVLRIPGTLNNKQADKKPVTIIEGDGSRYNPDDFDEFLVAPEVHRPAAPAATAEAMGVTKSGCLTLDPNAEEPTDKMMELVSIEPQFLQTWKKQRQFDSGDDSPSSYHMSLAYYAALAGWSDQEIANLLIAWNRRHGVTLNKVVGRADYVARTITQAKRAVADQKADKAMADAELFSGTQYENKEANREEWIQTIKAKLGIDIVRLVQFNEDNPTLLLELSTDRGKVEISLPGIKHIRRQGLFGDHVFQAIDKEIPAIKPKEWKAIVQIFGNLKERESLGEDATLAGITKRWLLEYLEGRTPLTHEQAFTKGYPFVKDGQWHFYFDHFFQWMQMVKGTEIKRNPFYRALSSIGVKSNKVAVPKQYGNTSRSYYIVPHKVARPPAAGTP